MKRKGRKEVGAEMVGGNRDGGLTEELVEQLLKGMRETLKENMDRLVEVLEKRGNTDRTGMEDEAVQTGEELEPENKPEEGKKEKKNENENENEKMRKKMKIRRHYCNSQK